MEGVSAVIAAVDDHAAGELHRGTTPVYRTGRPVAGVDIGPQLVISSHHSVRLAHWQPGVGDLHHKPGPSLPKIRQRGMFAPLRWPLNGQDQPYACQDNETGPNEN